MRQVILIPSQLITLKRISGISLTLNNTLSATVWSFFTFHIYITNFAAFSVVRSAVDSFLTLHTWQNDQSSCLTACDKTARIICNLLSLISFNPHLHYFWGKFLLFHQNKKVTFSSAMRTYSLAKTGWFFYGQNADEEEHAKRINLIWFQTVITASLSSTVLFIYFVFLSIHFGLFYW